ncbi:hypothetical protein UA08_03104 [Talaromyces atroroseus]|uniref:Xylanolytic transcriptional activator regulatory domain-containing protein n=1 Tax=Talaromyces atroroseus TaxID=1441469 RepID=A0A225B3U6_TALAT|nr:hypothetical protein UA08_03104 [Talaromyces atroroseus]OKL61515.1 hypothetical protein UA08_03104 [Talaromyces atroroseus]
MVDRTQTPSESGKAHLLMIDQDDQIVYSGPSTGMPLFARLGLLQTVEVSETLFFPVLHSPSLLSEFVAVTKRRLICTAQYGAFLMSILAVTVRLVENAKLLLPPSEREQASESYFELAQELLRSSKNKLDIRHILALYHLALFSEGRNSSTGPVSSFVAEAIGLAFTTGLHRSTTDFKMDPVTLQIRTRLFWALYSLDISLAYSQGRPPLIKLSECSVELPVIVDNEFITKTAILSQPESSPPVPMAAAVKITEVYMVLEQVLSAINAPSKTAAAAFSLDDRPFERNDIFIRAQERLDQIERNLPPYLTQVNITSSRQISKFFHSSRVRATSQFVRTLIARQALIDGLDANPPLVDEEIDSPTSEACRLSIDIIKTYSRLRHTGHLRYCSFQAVSHITAAAHTLIACMLRNSNLAFEHRPDLLTAIDLLLVMSSPFPSAKTVAQLLVQVSRTLDYHHGSTSQTEAAAIRVLARKFAPSTTSNSSPQTSASDKQPVSSSFGPAPPWQSGDNTTVLPQLGIEALQTNPFASGGFSADRNHSSSILDTLAPPQSGHSADIPPNYALTTEELAYGWNLSSPSTSFVTESNPWAVA